MPEISIFNYKFDPKRTTVDNIIPILVLLLLPAIIAEVLYGSTYLSIIIVILPEIGIYGTYNLIIRKFVISRRLRTTSIILFGLAFALLEQLIIRQTSLAPLAIVTPNNAYGRINGVNVLYLIWALGYEAIFGVLIPQKLFDFIYPEKEKTELIGWLGLSIALLVFIASGYVEWYAWTQIAYPQYNNTTPYQANTTYQLFGLLIMGLLIIFALFNQKRRILISKGTFQIPQQWMIDVMVFILSLSWFWLLLFAFGAFPGISILQPILLSLFIVVIASVALYYWSKSNYWTDLTTLSVIISALGASMVAGFITNGLINPLDILTKIILDIVAVVLLVKFYKKMSNPTIKSSKEEKKGKNISKEEKKEKRVVRKIT